MVASGMGMCPCTLAGRRGDSGIGELMLGNRQCYRRRGYIDTTRRAHGAVYGRWAGGLVGRTGGWVRPGGCLGDEWARPTIGKCAFRVYTLLLRGIV